MGTWRPRVRAHARRMKMLFAFLALLALLPACAASRSPSRIDDEPAREDGGADRASDAAAEPVAYVPESIPDATVLDCWPNTDDATFGGVYGEAKGACDQQVGWSCGNVLVEVDANGCVIGVTSQITNLSVDAAQQWIDCIAEQLAGACSRCDASETRTFYESCTLL